MDQADRWRVLGAALDLQAALLRRAQTADAGLGALVGVLVLLITWFMDPANEDVKRALASFGYFFVPRYEQTFGLLLAVPILYALLAMFVQISARPDGGTFALECEKDVQRAVYVAIEQVRLQHEENEAAFRLKEHALRTAAGIALILILAEQLWPWGRILVRHVCKC